MLAVLCRRNMPIQNGYLAINGDSEEPRPCLPLKTAGFLLLVALDGSAPGGGSLRRLRRRPRPKRPHGIFTLIDPLAVSMSIQAISAVWKYSKEKSNSLLVLLGIADFTNTEGDAWPSGQTLA